MIEQIDFYTLLIFLVSFIAGFITNWFWKRKKHKEFKETQDAQEEYWDAKKEEFLCQMEAFGDKMRCNTQCYDCFNYKPKHRKQL
jgi:hypothetical protein